MYHALLRRRVLRTFAKRNEGEYEDSLGAMALAVNTTLAQLPLIGASPR